MNEPEFSLRPASPADKSLLTAFVTHEHYVHRHLDWRPPIEWLGYSPYWLLFSRQELQAVLACPPDPPGVAWIRLFGVTASTPPTRAWRPLLQRCLEDLRRQSGMSIAAVALQQWFADLLIQSGFKHHQDIVVLSWDNVLPPSRPIAPEFILRSIQPDDLPAIAAVDQNSFELIWRNSLDGVTLSFQQAAYATLIEYRGQPIAYQISTSTPLSTHLARLAVLPGYQRQNLAYALVYDLFAYFRRNGSWQLTVNTQNSNTASLALYQTLGFTLTGDRYPVYLYPI